MSISLSSRRRGCVSPSSSGEFDRVRHCLKGRRVVVTGLGMVTPLGNDVPSSWAAMLQGKSGVRRIDRFDPSPLTSQICGGVNNFDPAKFMPVKDVRRTDTFTQFALAAAEEAVADAELFTKLEVNEQNAHLIGVAIGSGIGGLPFLEKCHATMLAEGPRKITPFLIPAIVANMASGYISIKYGITGPNVCLVSACATGLHNIGEAARLVAYGDADVMLCGGTEMSTSMLGVGGFCAMHALSTRNNEPEKASRPWDRDRDGFVLGEGAGIMVVESLEHAQQRGAKIYAEIIGYGLSGDANHVTAPEPEGRGAALCMRGALRDAGINPSDIDYINAHGTSTPPGDIVEVRAVKKVFAEHAYKLAISSTKSMTGHLLGAAGAVEAIVSVLAIRDQVAPPTINLDNPDDGCDLNFVPHKAQKMKINHVLCNSFGFGGTNVCLALKKYSS